MALGGAHLKVAAEVWVPWVMLQVTPEDGGLKASGILVDLIDTIAAQLNFTYSVVRPADGEWGRFHPNGSATGMIGMNQRRETDMALGPFSISYERSKVVDYSEPITMDSFGIFLPRPRLEKDLASFTKPFSWQVWAILGLMLVLGIGLSSFINWLTRGWASQGPGKDVLQPSSILKALLVETIVTLPTMLTGRVLIGAWLLSALILQSAYQGVLTSMLAVPWVTVPVDSLEDLVTQTKIPYSYETGTHLHQMFQFAESGLFKTVFENAFEVVSLFEEREHMKEQRFALICDFFSMKKVMSDDFSNTATCNYYIAKKPIWVNSLSFTFPKKSSLLPHINKWLVKLLESGVVNRYINEYSSNATVCLRPPGREGGTSTLTLSLEDLGGIFLLLMGGLVAGTVAFILENLTVKLSLG